MKFLRTISCVVLLAVLGLAAPQRAAAQVPSTEGSLNVTGYRILFVAGVVVVGAVVTGVIVHNSGRRTITGCVKTGASGAGLTSDGDNTFYAFTGDTARVKTGDRMTLKVKKRKVHGSKSLAWEPQKVVADLGPCPA
jgi:hypothetical protein